MSDTKPILQIAAQFTKEATFLALVRPYENKSPVAVSFQTQAKHRALEHPGHWCVELEVTLTGTGAEQVLYTAKLSQEFIIVANGLSEDELSGALRLQIPARMFAYARSQLATLSMTTGYGPLTLPPVPDAYILQSNKTET